MKKIDLHVHTTYSDGVHTPEEILELAKKAGIKVIALSDHNWPHNMKEKVALAKKMDMETIEALEVSSIYNGATVHFLGYSKDFNLKVIAEKLEIPLKKYRERLEKFVEVVNTSGIVKVDMEEIDQKFGGYNHDFQAMVIAAPKLGIRPSEVVKLFKGKGYEAGEKNWVMSPKEAIEMIHQAGGIAIWAHSLHTKRKNAGKLPAFKKLLDEFIGYGLDGVEVDHPEHTEEDKKILLDLAIKKELLISGGSDFHGLSVHTHRALGKNGPDEKQFAAIMDKLDQIAGK